MAKSSWSQALAWASLAGALAGCSTVPDSHAPTGPQSGDPLAIDGGSGDPVPRIEPPSRSGNPDTYTVFGRRYRVKETSEGYREQGIASWYGWDFHGRKTSSGPRYNMFDLTAAHKSLPIPTYVRVTNLENGRNVVVKVNDRGPFVGRRIIDLSYAAADRLGMLGQGTAQVEVAALEPYQSLPELAARRAESRERLASRQNQPEPTFGPSAIQIARAESTGPTTAPAVNMPSIHWASAATLERSASRTRSIRPTSTVAVRPAPSSAPRPAIAKSPIRTKEQDRASTPIRLASAAPVLKGKGMMEERRVSAGTGNKNGRLNSVEALAERRDGRSLSDRPISSARRDSRAENSRIESGAGNRQSARAPSRNPNATKPAMMRLASLKVNRSRVATD